MPTYNPKEKIVEHYDKLSPFYHSLWGKHLHHGYWISGNETKEEAQLALTEHLAQSANIQVASKILDVGCGFGASSIYLANHYGSETTGITISPVQVEMAQKAAAAEKARAKFLLMDAEEIPFINEFDLVWSIESISHYKNKALFFQHASRALKKDGTIAIIDWFKKDGLTEAKDKKYIQPINKGMLVEMYAMNDYLRLMESNGFKITKLEDISKETSKTWEIAADVIKNKMFWRLAFQHGGDFVDFLHSFQSMRKGFASETFVYGLIIAQKRTK